MIDPEKPPDNHNSSVSFRKGYPRRDSFFALRFVRLIAKAAAQSIGPEACWLLSLIAHTEDKKPYSGAVTFWNEQLMELCGFGGRARLVRTRDKAVAAGWLHYEPGSKGTPGRYWVLIPPQFENSPDTSVDENPSEYSPETTPPEEHSVPNQNGNRTATDSIPFQIRTATTPPEEHSVPNQNGNRTATERHSTLYPVPKDPPVVPQGDDGQKPGEDVPTDEPDKPPYTSEFESFWETCPKRAAKRRAFNAWKRAKKVAAASERRRQGEGVAEFLTRRMADYAASVVMKEEKYILHPATWLNGGNWDDDTGSRVPTADDLLNWRP